MSINSLQDAFDIADITEESRILSESYNYMANFWKNWYLYLGITNTVLAAAASASSLGKIINSNLAGILSAIVAILSAVSAFINPTAMFTEHRKAKEKFIDFEARVRKLNNRISNPNDISEELQQLINQLYDDFAKAKIDSPQIPEWVYREGEKRAKRKAYSKKNFGNA